MSQTTTYNVLVGYYLQECRVEKGLDQAVLAEMAGMSQPVLSRLEMGKASIKADQLFEVCNALGVLPSSLLAKVESNIEAIDHEESIEVKTSKDAAGKVLLTGAAIVAVLGILATRK